MNRKNGLIASRVWLWSKNGGVLFVAPDRGELKSTNGLQHIQSILSFRRNLMNPQKPFVRISVGGPYLVSEGVPVRRGIIVTNEEEESVRWEEGPVYPIEGPFALCRCGESRNKPFCDGSHENSRFDGAETASHRPYIEQAETFTGPTMSLMDAESLCAFARFCDPNGRVWNLVGKTDDPESRKHFVRQTGDCPAGRLVARENKGGEMLEPRHVFSIVLVEDPSRQCSGPIWLRGGLPLFGADGYAYEIRNRITLCRCGASGNKPFCDGTHASTGFRDDS